MKDIQTWTQQELLDAYRGYVHLQQTGAVSSEEYGGLFRAMIDEHIADAPGQAVIRAATVLLQEMARRWADTAEKELAMIRVGTHLWYVYDEDGTIEECIVETVDYKDGKLDCFGANFCETEDFDVFNGSAIDSCFFRSAEQAWAALRKEGAKHGSVE